MELPDDLILLVSEFSKPVTRPDWRVIRHMESLELHWLILAIYNTKRVPVIERFVTYYDQFEYLYIFHQGFVVNIVKN